MRKGKGGTKSDLMGLFRTKSKEKKKRAIAFVDFEHWYISLEKLHNQKPDIRAWRDELAEKYIIDDIYFFADFSNQSLRSEIEKIRQVTNLIIETKNASSFYKKDFTDFIMLDHIYQTAINRNDVDTFIIFSGDGHFSSVVAYLCNRRDREVGIYGIRDAVSSQLKNTATWVKEIPAEEDKLKGFYYPILQNLRQLELRPKPTYPAFKSTCEYVSKYYELNPQDVRSAMLEMLDKGYLTQTEVTVSGRSLRVLKANWTKAISDGLWIEQGETP
ncbi:MAG: NYN domain-containing protein [Clostridia bacterium]|nr:NYN domain-containing protein [Clostridia bacterium]